MVAQSEATKIYELGLREGEKRSLLAQGKFPDQRINQPGESGPYQDKTGIGKKPKTEGQKLEEKGDYIDTGEGTDSAGNLLMIEGNPSFDINPNKKTPTESEKRRQDKLRDRGSSGQQGADTAKKKLKDMGIDPTALPNFLKNINPVDLLKIVPLLIGNPMQQMADASAGSRALQVLPRNKSGSHRDALQSGELTPEQLIETLKIAAPLFNQASHDNRQFKSVPATGVRGDQPAGEIRDFLNRKDENLLQTQDRLRV